MTTARDIIHAAMRKITVLGVGSSLEDQEANDCLMALNSMLASWSINGALIFTETKETFNLTDAQSYTIGNGGEFDTIIPKRIVAAHVTHAGSDVPLKLIDNKDYSIIQNKGEQGTPRKLYFNGDYPMAVINLWPISQNSATLTLYSEKPLTAFSGLTTEVDLPAEYERALVFNLAIEMAPEFGEEAPLSVRQIASAALKSIKIQNRKNDRSVMSVDGAFLGNHRYHINRGY